MYKNILVAFDGSESGKNALDQAASLSRETGCNMAAVIVRPPVNADLGTPGADRAGILYKETGIDRVPSIKTAIECPVIEATEVEGMTYKAIIDAAIARDADLIVMGRIGSTGLERVLLGSVTSRVIGYSPIDILVVPKDTVVGWRTMLLAIDGSTYSSAAAERAIELAKEHNANLKIISVADIPYEAYGDDPEFLNKMLGVAKNVVGSGKARAEEFEINTEAIVRDGPAHEEIVEAAKEVKANLIIMGSHGRTGLERILMGSVTERVIGHSPCPVLVVKSH